MSKKRGSDAEVDESRMERQLMKSWLSSVSRPSRAACRDDSAHSEKLRNAESGPDTTTENIKNAYSEESQNTHQASQPPAANAVENIHQVATESQPSTASGIISSNATKSTTNGIRIIEITGDIFAAPTKSVLIHACNCYGSWGAGIAAAFKQHYPKAFQVHKKYCETHAASSLIGTAQLIQPVDLKGPRHYVGCLFTSRRFGKRKDSPEEILRATGPAMEDLLRQVREIRNEEGEDEIGEIRMCQINSGLFNVPWSKTKDVIRALATNEDESLEILVYSKP